MYNSALAAPVCNCTQLSSNWITASNQLCSVPKGTRSLPGTGSICRCRLCCITLSDVNLVAGGGVLNGEEFSYVYTERI